MFLSVIESQAVSRPTVANSCGLQWFTETCSLGVCLNEMIQIEHNDLINLWKLRASEALFSALHYARDGVIVTGASHEIQVGPPGSFFPPFFFAQLSYPELPRTLSRKDSYSQLVTADVPGIWR